MRKERREFLEFAHKHLTLAGVEIRLRHGKIRGANAYTLAEYGPGEEIIVDTRKETWFQNYVHEYAHFCQDTLNTPLWQAWDANHTDLQTAGLMEREAELMVIAMNHLFNLGINEEKLIERIEGNLDHYGIEL